MKRLGLRAGVVVLVFVVADLVGTLLYLNHVTRFAEELEQAKADAAIVLFADFGAGGLGHETLRRVGFAAKAFEEGAFDHIVCAGGARPRRNLYGSELMRQWLLAAGIPADRVFLEKRSNDTRSNLQESFKIADEKSWQSAWIVSSPLHIFRVKEITRNRRGPPIVFPAAYSYGDCHPNIDGTALWLHTHYEWAAWLLQGILPARGYEKVLDLLRGG